MRLSVIIPYYNRNAWIGKLLDSLLDQDLASSEYEIIVVDDGSDETPLVLKDYASKYPQVHYHKIEHAGVSPARNYGISVARGEWLYFCDSDDYVQHNVLGIIVEIAEEKNVEMIMANYRIIRPSNIVTSQKKNFSTVKVYSSMYDYLASDPPVFTSGVWWYLLRRSVVVENGLSFNKIYYVEDRLFILNLIPVVGRVAYMNVDLYYYVQQEQSILHSFKKHNLSDYKESWMMYIEKLASFISNPSVPSQTADYIRISLLNHSSYDLLSNVFKYCPVKTTIEIIKRLERLGCYPIGSTKKISNNRLRLVNNRSIWILLCHIYHLLPLKIRMKY